ncbi:MAG: hypothetical protein KBD78_11725 [Oligoflexales bacterium]|nr:hypothetical protein [Oligoflexales bacterium]
MKKISLKALLFFIATIFISCDGYHKNRSKVNEFKVDQECTVTAPLGLHLRECKSGVVPSGGTCGSLVLMKQNTKVRILDLKYLSQEWLEVEDLTSNLKGFASSLYLDCKNSSGVFPPSDFDPRNSSGMRSMRDLIMWAYTVEPDVDEQKLRQDMIKMRDNGANAVYIAHANQGFIADGYPHEVGMTFSVWHAARSAEKNLFSKEAQERGESIIERMHWALKIARDLDLKVVFAIGYQIQMSEPWNNKYPNALRRSHDGSLLKIWGSGETASFYHDQFQKDIRTYYNWINDEYVSKYNNIVGLNLADEPQGADFSEAAENEFKKRTSLNLLPPRESALSAEYLKIRGKFLAEQIADYAGITASMWQKINSSVWTMMTFHIQREMFWFPSIEALFAKTPANFIVSADTHYHDSLPTQRIKDLGYLYNLVRNMAIHSNIYRKPIVLWSSANGWGLTPNGYPDWAKENIQIVTNGIKEMGALSSGHLIWGFNIKGQGVFGYDNSVIFNPDDIFKAVIDEFSLIRDSFSSKEDVKIQELFLINQDALLTKIGKGKYSHLTFDQIFKWNTYLNKIKNNNSLIMVEGAASQQLLKQNKVQKSEVVFK